MSAILESVNIPRPEEGILRRDAISALRDLDTDDDALRSLATLYIRDDQRRLARLREAADQGDSELVRQAAHAIRNTAVTFGADGLAALARRVEDAARLNRLPDEQTLADLFREAAAVKARLEDLLRSLGGERG